MATPTLLLALALAAPPIRGLAVAPHFEPGRDPDVLRRRVDEVAALGATHVSVLVQWSQRDVRATVIAPYPHGTEDEQVRLAIRRARERGLKVLLFPTVRVALRGEGEWRGTLAPADPEAWWRSYRAFILHYADLAAAEGVEIFSVGSELVSMEAHADRWRDLIRAVRARFPGRLTYSANWDHFRSVPFWEAVDYIGLNAYHELTKRDDASLAELTRAWIAVRDRVLAWQRPAGRPLLITEVGYPSLDGGARQPWNYTLGTDPDPEEQRRAYAAFCAAWEGVPDLAGVFFWIWAGEGGPRDTSYTPRGKPAADVLRRWFRPPAGGPAGPPPQPALPPHRTPR